MSLNINSTIDADAVKAKKNLEDLDDDTKKISQSMITTMRQTAQIGIFFAQATGKAINQILALQIEAALLSIELIATTQAALAVGAPIFTFRAGAQLATIITMVILIQKIKTKQDEAASQTQGIVSGLRMITFRVIIFAPMIIMELIL